MSLKALLRRYIQKAGVTQKIAPSKTAARIIPKCPATDAQVWFVAYQNT